MRHGSTVLLCVLTLSACAGAPDSDESMLVLAAASLTESLSEAAKSFEEAHPDRTIDLSFS